MDPQPIVPHIMERLFGANWRTSLSGVLSTIALGVTAWNAMPAASRNDPAVVTPALLWIIVKTLKDVNTKDKNVAGTPGTGFIVGTSPETVRQVKDQ